MEVVSASFQMGSCAGGGPFTEVVSYDVIEHLFSELDGKFAEAWVVGL